MGRRAATFTSAHAYNSCSCLLHVFIHATRGNASSTCPCILHLLLPTSAMANMHIALTGSSKLRFFVRSYSARFPPTSGCLQGKQLCFLKLPGRHSLNCENCKSMGPTIGGR